jgi:hypothetical protein
LNSVTPLLIARFGFVADSILPVDGVSLIGMLLDPRGEIRVYLRRRRLALEQDPQLFGNLGTVLPDACEGGFLTFRRRFRPRSQGADNLLNMSVGIRPSLTSLRNVVRESFTILALLSFVFAGTATFLSVRQLARIDTREPAP